MSGTGATIAGLMTEPAAVMGLALSRRRPCRPLAGSAAWRRLAAWSASLLLMCCAAGASAQVAATPASAPTVDEAKAAHLHRFAGFVEWPAASFSSPDAPIVVGVVGSPSLHKDLSLVVAGRLVQNRAIQVVELSEPRQVAGVHMLMITRGAAKRASEWLAACKGQPVLTVTDIPQGLERGAALGFVETEGRLRFEASVPAAEGAGVRLSSRLLSLAERVVK
ncbi:YfiR family protein [Piscinibacter sp. HJYY11]|uniref:YfiR family protein n=1 Tax=Piscinibacter sp. HJYY11 TaxID=2801333 RepID=UPI00191DECFF|nr:YfiR family protein [Piscinibacter sp. HJYY11]MBL0726507.1 YfiR family protein [Piscinibacter sp. HJYY11]